MRRQLILFFWALFLLTACKDNESDRDIIKKQKMAQLMCDVHLIDGTMVLYNTNDSLYKYGTNRYSLVFKKYDVDSAAFNKSIRYYAARPDEMIEIYDQITKMLTAKSDSTNNVQAEIMDKELKELEAKSKKQRARKADSLKRDSIKKEKAIQLRSNNRIK